MPRLTRQPLVALLAALAALLAPWVRPQRARWPWRRGRRSPVRPRPPSQAPPGRVTTGRELRDTAVRRVQHGGSEVERRRHGRLGARRPGRAGPRSRPVALAAVVLLVAAAWWVRRVPRWTELLSDVRPGSAADADPRLSPAPEPTVRPSRAPRRDPSTGASPCPHLPSAPSWRSGILAGSLYFALTTPARLGLDLRGGTQIVLETQDSPTVKADKESTDRALEVLRRRVDALGVSEPSLTRSGDRRIIVELPGVQDPREAAEVIGRTAQLTFHPVLGVPEPTAAPSDRRRHARRRRRQRRPAPTRRRARRRRRGRPAAPARPGRAHRRRRRRRRGGDRPAGRRRLVRHRRLPRHRPGRVGAADRRRGLPAARRPAATGRHRARRPGDLLAAGRPERPLRRRHHRRHHPDHRPVHDRRGQGPRGPDPRRRAAGAGRGHRAADRRPDPRRRGHRRQREGGRHRRRPDRRCSSSSSTGCSAGSRRSRSPATP